MNATKLRISHERALRAIADAEREHGTRFHPAGWIAYDYILMRRDTRAMIRLEELGLIETNLALDLEDPERWPRTRGGAARTTEKGRELLAVIGNDDDA